MHYQLAEEDKKQKHHPVPKVITFLNFSRWEQDSKRKKGVIFKPNNREKAGMARAREQEMTKQTEKRPSWRSRSLPADKRTAKRGRHSSIPLVCTAWEHWQRRPSPVFSPNAHMRKTKLTERPRLIILKPGQTHKWKCSLSSSLDATIISMNFFFKEAALFMCVHNTETTELSLLSL